jgi:hypothetical protein
MPHKKHDVGLLCATTSTIASENADPALNKNQGPEDELSLIIPEDSFEVDLSLLDALTNSDSVTQPRRKSVHDLQADLDFVLRDVTNLVDTCLSSPFIPRSRGGSK